MKTFLLITVFISFAIPAHALHFAQPDGIAVDSQENVFVSAYNSNRVYRIAPTGEVYMILDKRTTEDNLRVDQPTDLELGTEGNVHVSSWTGDEAVITPFGVSWFEPKSNFNLIDPKTDQAGNVYSWGVDSIIKTAPGGAVTVLVDTTDPIFSFPNEFAVDFETQTVFVTDGGFSSVIKAAPGEPLESIIGWSGDGEGNELVYPTRLAVGPSGNVYVVGYWSDNVFKITPSGDISMIMDENMEITTVAVAIPVPSIDPKAIAIGFVIIGAYILRRDS